MPIILQETLRGLLYAPYYAALALGAYRREGVAVEFVSIPDAGGGRAVRRNSRCRVGRADARHADI